MSFLSGLKKVFRYFSITPLEKRIGYVFANVQLKKRALTHKSWANEQNNHFHNERLEFLGDAVLDLCVSDLLMQKYPRANEGDLSKMRASLVNTLDLAEVALSLSLDKELKLGISEMKDKGQLKPRLLACVLEALVGAVYLDGGYPPCKKLVKKLVWKQIKKGPVNRDYKSMLQEVVQKKFQRIPLYNMVAVKGPQHQKIFIMEVRLEQKVLGQGKGKSKKEATQVAAQEALKKLNIESPLGY